MIPESKIDPALGKIEELFVEQCKHGAQNGNLPQEGAACGQFIGPGAKDRPQRGLHGTAAALRVLAQGRSPEANKLVSRLVWYVQNRPTLHKEHKEPRQDDRTFEDDQQNVIKLSEVLYSLSYVGTGQGATDTLVDQLAKQLLSARKEEKGWTYFLTSTEPVDNLPTAFAILALSQHKYEQDIQEQVVILTNNVLARDSQPANITEASVRIFCLFALVFRKEELSQDEQKKYKRAFIELWEAHKKLLGLDLEQGIEYANGPINYYMRIPWQLYLLALAARLDPRRISSLAAQRKLDQIFKAVETTGFRYPYSGAPLSSRTNSILFDVLCKIKRFNKRNFFHFVYYCCDKIRTFLGHPIFSWLTLAAVVTVVAFFVASSLKKGKMEDVGTGLQAEMIWLMALYAFERVRKAQ